MNVDVYLDDATRCLAVGPTRVSKLRVLLEVGADRWLAIHEAEFERFVADDEDLIVVAGVRLTTSSPLAYRPHPKHKREPACGRKGSICPTRGRLVAAGAELSVAQQAASALGDT